VKKKDGPLSSDSVVPSPQAPIRITSSRRTPSPYLPSPTHISLKYITTASFTQFNSNPRPNDRPFPGCFVIMARYVGSVAICGEFERGEEPLRPRSGDGVTGVANDGRPSMYPAPPRSTRLGAFLPRLPLSVGTVSSSGLVVGCHS